jgi:large subunit ribosomal protein L21
METTTTKTPKKTAPKTDTAMAVIVTGGKQYQVAAGKTITIEKLLTETGQTVTFDQVLMVHNGSKTTLGSPTVKGATVTGEVVDQFRGEKIRVFTYKSKKRQRRTLGHRQSLTKVKITAVTTA